MGFYSRKYALIDRVRGDFLFDVAHSRWQPWPHFMQKSAATWWVNTKCLPGAYAAAYASSWSIVQSFVLVVAVSVCQVYWRMTWALVKLWRLLHWFSLTLKEESRWLSPYPAELDHHG